MPAYTKNEFNRVLTLLDISHAEWNRLDIKGRKGLVNKQFRSVARQFHPDKNKGRTNEDFILLSNFKDQEDWFKHTIKIPIPVRPEKTRVSQSWVEDESPITDPEAIKQSIQIGKFDPVFSFYSNEQNLDKPNLLLYAIEQKQWPMVKRLVCNIPQLQQHHDLMVTAIAREQGDLYDMSKALLSNPVKGSHYTSLLLKLINRLEQPGKEAFDLMSDIKKHDSLNRLDPELIHSLRPLEAARKKAMINAYKTLLEVLSIEQSLLQSTLRATQWVVSFFSRQPSPKEKTMTDDELYMKINAYIAGNGQDNLSERKAAHLAAAFVDGHLTKDLLLTIIYVDICPLEHYILYSKDAFDKNPASNDGGINLVNTFICNPQALNGRRFNSYPKFHQNGVLDISDIERGFYGVYQGKPIQLDYNHDFPQQSLPTLIKVNIANLQWGDDPVLSASLGPQTR